MRPSSILPLLFLPLLLAACGPRRHTPSLRRPAGKTEIPLPQPVPSGKDAAATAPDSPGPAISLLPVGRKAAGIILHRTAYDLSYNPELRIPNWVAWHLTAEHLRGKASRKDIPFHEDEDVPMPRATTYDYIQSGYDRGHLCPAGDNKWDRQAMEESFLLTNVCPQNPNLNRGDWNELEMQCRDWARRYGDLHIVCGPILLNRRHKTIGRNRITVPEAFFKVILCTGRKPKAIGFVYRNTDGNRPKDSYVNTVDQVERITGLDFFSGLPDDVETEVEASANLADW